MCFVLLQKQDYSYNKDDESYKYKSIKAKVIQIRHSEKFHKNAKNQQIGIILDKTNFYAEHVTSLLVIFILYISYE